MINGIINVYKEKGFTSFDVVAKMRGMFHQKKIGHTGTLDPDAEGVLPVCLGKATKVCDLLTDKDKEYKAVLLLGVETDTQDISGEILNQKEVDVSEDMVREAILSFVGEYEQVPPMYSALKVNGQKLCDLARKGITVERKSRKVTIHHIEILSMNLPEVEIIVSCSKGTYIRTLCDDIGKKLGCFGCMKSLLRTKVDRFELEDAYKLSELEELLRQPESEWSFVAPIDTVFQKYVSVTAMTEAQKLVDNGNRIPDALILDMSEKKMQEKVRLYDANDRFIGIYSYLNESKEYKPVKLFME
ncbi:MAG: tRNA pseudouridine(55) synthase TruB [Agathobacter sp.]|nr:tRNA pseudouridine(55) synthase TruB [Agathobacter sp.]